MTLAPPTAPALLGLEPLQLPWGIRLTPDQFELVCQANPDAVLELAANGQLIAMTPTGGETGQRNQTLGACLWLAARQSGLPLKLFDSSTGFRLPDGSVLSPDVSLVRQEHWEALSPEQRRSVPPLCPDLVVELASPSDQGPQGAAALRQKMDRYRRNGAQLGWLLFPAEQAVEIWCAPDDSQPQRIEPALQLNGGPQFPGLTIDLTEVWQS